MHPVLCSLGPVHIYTYGLLLAIAFFVCSFFARQEAARQNVNPELILSLSLTSFIWGIVGARAFYVLQNAGYYLRNPLEVLMVQHGGLVWYGGFAGGCVGAVAYLKKKRIGVYKVFDIIAPYIALGQALGRLGCFFNGCCFGRSSAYGVYFPVHDAYLLPTQLYSSFLLVGIYAIVRFLQRRPHREGTVFFAYIFLYATKRFCMEFFRADSQHVFLGLTIFQIISFLLICFSILQLARLGKKNQAGSP
jgi:phosphatidylglycerol---prolipoprotein diacylglyceryl transferase